MSEVVDTAVNGLGRIGIPYARQAIDDPELRLCALGVRSIDAYDIGERLALDSVHGRFAGHQVDARGDYLFVDDDQLPVANSSRITPGLWREFSDNLVLADCTGYYRTLEKAKIHIDTGGARAVVLSSPSKDLETITIVRGVNDTDEVFDQAAESGVVAVSSCSTNCIAPILKLFKDTFPVESAHAVIVHARTNSQPLVDGRGDTTSARRSADTIVFAKTGSATEVSRLIPGVPFDAYCYRTPMPDGSVAQLFIDVRGRVNEDDVMGTLLAVKENPNLRDVIGTTRHDMFAQAVIGENYSSVIDLKQVEVRAAAERTTIALSAWFDNEWGYTNRVREVAKTMGQRLLAR